MGVFCGRNPQNTPIYTHLHGKSQRTCNYHDGIRCWDGKI